MAGRIGNWNRVETGVGLKVDPKVVLTSQILQLAQLDLNQAIDAELTDNPALERLHDDTEPVTDDVILRSVAPQELKPTSEDFEFHRSLPNDSDGFDWIDLASTSSSLWDHLRAQLITICPPFLERLADYVVECVNERGYLTTPIEEIALATNHSLEEVELVVAKLKECEPAGVGAADVQECLILQLRGVDTVEAKLAKVILRHHMDDFLSKKTLRIAKKYRVLPDVVEAAFSEIRSLNPFPAEGFSASSDFSKHTGARPPAVIPDVVLSLAESGWIVDVQGADPNSLVINRTYRKRYDELKSSLRAPADEKKHVNEYVRRAANFIQSLYQRRRTLRKIGEYLVNHQAGFVSTGQYQFLRSLTRTQMAKDLAMHESTVSRATMGKFVQIANGEVVPFEVFFKPALRIQKMIEEILETENPSSPLSDEAIAKLLEQKGVKVARRTVNKYRDRTRLLSSRKRRSA